MKDKVIYTLNELGMDANDRVGKKCANLGEMRRLGIPVPEGFALSLKAKELFLEKTGAKDKVRKCLEPIIGQDLGQDQAARDRVKALSETIRDIIVKQDMPDLLKTEIENLYEALCEEVNEAKVAVAVRSSGIVSMPGQMDTYLNIRGKAEVIHHVKKVWASAYTPRAIHWRLKRQELSLTEATNIGVAVIRMIPGQAAGVGFTVDPITGERGKVVIEGNWGVGESVVQGLVNPDVFHVIKETFQIGRIKIGTKRKYYELLESGIEVREVPEEKRSIPCLSEDLAIALTKMAVKLEEHFQYPQDFEWVIEKHTQRPYLVQTRPAQNIPEEKSATDKILDLLMAKMR